MGISIKKVKIDKDEILREICYTELVYGRINKKLRITLQNQEIERYIRKILEETPKVNYEIIGKNYYVHNFNENIRITINRNTFRIITVDRIDKEK